VGGICIIKFVTLSSATYQHLYWLFGGIETIGICLCCLCCMIFCKSSLMYMLCKHKRNTQLWQFAQKKNSDNLPATLYIPLTRTMDALYLQAEWLIRPNFSPRLPLILVLSISPSTHHNRTWTFVECWRGPFSTSTNFLEIFTSPCPWQVGSNRTYRPPRAETYPY